MESAASGLPAVASIVSGSLLPGLDWGALVILRSASPILLEATRSLLVEALSAKAVAAATGLRRTASLRALAGVCGHGGGGHRASAKVAAKFLGDEASEVRRTAALALTSAAKGETQEREALVQLCAALADKDERVCSAASRGIIRLATKGDRTVTNAALAYLHHEFPWSRRAATSVLCEVAGKGDADIVVVLTEALERDEDWRIRASAARALARMAERGDVKVLAAMQHRLQDLNASVRKVVAGAIVHIATSPSAALAQADRHKRPAQASGPLLKRQCLSRAGSRVSHPRLGKA